MFNGRMDPDLRHALQEQDPHRTDRRLIMLEHATATLYGFADTIPGRRLRVQAYRYAATVNERWWRRYWSLYPDNDPGEAFRAVFP